MFNLQKFQLKFFIAFVIFVVSYYDFTKINDYSF